MARLGSLLARRPEAARSIAVGGPISGSEKRHFLLESDGYILPSRWESHSVALLEALALGVPCLVSGALHIAPRLRRYDAAVLAMPNVGSLAEALVELGSAAGIGARGREMVATEFSWHRAVDDLVPQLGTLGLLR
jgi:glycosyltransferase involved in cell wall biosynthesis